MNCEALKFRPVQLEYIAHLSLKTISRATTQWPLLFINLNIERKKGEKEDSFMWLWEGCKFDSEMAHIQLGTNSNSIIQNLALAHLIYPDGTYNEDGLQQLINTQTEEQKWKK